MGDWAPSSDHPVSFEDGGWLNHRYNSLYAVGCMMVCTGAVALAPEAAGYFATRYADAWMFGGEMVTAEMSGIAFPATATTAVAGKILGAPSTDAAAAMAELEGSRAELNVSENPVAPEDVSPLIKGNADTHFKGPGEDFSAYTSNTGGGVYAALGKDGFLEFAIEKGAGKPSGGQMFNEASSGFGNNVLGIRGVWLGGGSMTSNFDSFRAAIASGFSPEEAALQTFTGEMAMRNGFPNVTIVTDTAKKVIVEFRP